MLKMRENLQEKPIPNEKCLDLKPTHVWKPSDNLSKLVIVPLEETEISPVQH